MIVREMQEGEGPRKSQCAVLHITSICAIACNEKMELEYASWNVFMRPIWKSLIISVAPKIFFIDYKKRTFGY